MVVETKEVKEEVEVKEDGIENETNQDHNEDGHEPINPEDTDATGKDEEADEGSGGNEEEVEQVEDKETPLLDDKDVKIQKLEEEIKGIKDTVARPPAQVSQPKVYTPEERERIEQRFGGVPFEGVMAFNQLVAIAVQGIQDKFTEELQQFKKDSVINGLVQQKEFSDIRTYMNGVNEYLNKYPKIHHGKEELLKDAYYYAKGKGVKNTVKKIINRDEKNRRVALSTRTRSSGSSGSSSKGTSLKLTPAEESAWQSFGKHSFSTRDEYAKSLSRFQKK